MPDEVRSGLPFIYVTWLTGLLSGDKSCWYAPWYKAHHYKPEKMSSSGDLSKWKADHAVMVTERAAALRDSGADVRVESQNKFTIRGRTALLAGQPDIVAVYRAGEDNGDLLRGIALSDLTLATSPSVQVHECKTGQRRDSDYWQAVIYMLFVPRAFEDLEELPVSGRVAYKDGLGDLSVEPRHAGQEALDAVLAAISKVAQAVPPRAVPSASECGFCDIRNCSFRSGDTGDALIDTELF